MNDLIKRFSEQLKESSAGTKLVAVLVGVSMVVITGLAAVVSNRPDYQLAFSGLSDHEMPTVTKALAEAGVDFEVSQPPAPFAVFVDGDRRTAAYKAAYGAGALDKPLKGILADAGVASVFSSSEERLQAVRKREWGEMEKMLELLDFVVSAQVRTPPQSASPLAGADASPTTASVTLRIVGGRSLSHAQSETVANLVSRGLGIEKQNLVISNQAGDSVFDGAEDAQDDRNVRDLLAHQSEYDVRLTEDANRVLESILGPRMAQVSITSEWDYDQSTTRTETMGKGSVLSEQKNSTERPGADGGLDLGGPAGVSTNVAVGDPTGDPDVPAKAVEPLVEKTNEERKEYRPSTTLEERVRYVPSLKRLSVALFLDQDIDGTRAANLEQAVKAAVGFDEQRDAFQSVTVPFFTEDVPEDPAAAETATEEPSAPNPMMETLLKRGVEIVTAVVFLFLLVKSLRSSSKSDPAGSAPAAPEDEIDPELLARAHVEELLKSDPEKIGSILSSWAKDDRPLTGARS